MYSKNRTHRITYSGNLTTERDFYRRVLYKIVKRIYKTNPIYLERPVDNTVLLMINSKDLVNFKQRVFNLPCGKKDTIRIPRSILRNRNLLRWCMRGIGDTDFCLSFKRNRKGLYTEPRLELYTKSEFLLKDVTRVLKRFDFKFSVEKRTKKYHGFMIRMYGRKNLNRWINNFGFSNFHILQKIKSWQRLGYFPKVARSNG